MRINKNLKKVLVALLTAAIFIGGFIAIVYGFYWGVKFIWFLMDNNFFGFPIWTFLIVLFVIAVFFNNVYSELKFNKLAPTRKNLISQTKLSIIIFTLFSLVAALAMLFNKSLVWFYFYFSYRRFPLYIYQKF